jgi:hypothetical protein
MTIKACSTCLEAVMEHTRRPRLEADSGAYAAGLLREVRTRHPYFEAIEARARIEFSELDEFDVARLAASLILAFEQEGRIELEEANLCQANPGLNQPQKRTRPGPGAPATGPFRGDL